MLEYGKVQALAGGLCYKILPLVARGPEPAAGNFLEKLENNSCTNHKLCTMIGK